MVYIKLLKVDIINKIIIIIIIGVIYDIVLSIFFVLTNTINPIKRGMSKDIIVSKI
tara:strand:- start:326 stop:493 length:168 start_codon:yes stop_codon:yes gene_type:complete